MDYRFTIDSTIEFITAIAAIITVILLWNNRKSPEVKYLILLEIFVAVWAITYAFEFATDDLNTKILWSKLSYFGIAFLPVFYFLFTTAFSQKNNIISKRNVALLSILPLATIVLILTNDRHSLVWTDVTMDPILNIAHYQHAVWFWIYWGYALLLIFLGLFTLIHSIYKFTAYYKSQIGTLLVASLFPVVGNLMYVTGINPLPGFDWTPVSFVLTGLIIAIGIVRYRMFDLVPFARNKLMDTMDDGAIIINPEGFIEDCNPAVYKIFSLHGKSIVRKNFKNVFARYQALAGAIDHNAAERVQIEVDGKTGKKNYQVQVSPINYHNKKYSGSLLLIHDVTSIKQTEDELKAINSQLVAEIKIREKLIEDLDAFAHTVAHDLKNSLGSIVSSGELVEETIQNGDLALLSELAVLIKKSAEKSMQITQELLILATVNHHKIEKKELDMNKIFREARNQLHDLTQKYQAEIIEPNQWLSAKGYAPWIEDVWTNFLSNALKYGGTPPVIEVGSEKTGNHSVKFWIKDNGNGLTPTEQTKLFKKYSRLDPEKAEGYGLGLSIIKRIIEKLDGTVGVESAGMGNGSTFYFILPAIK